MMRILALTDIHGAYDLALEIVTSEPADVVVVGGDLTTLGSVSEAEQAVRRIQAVAKRTVSVSGNMDLPSHDDLQVRLGTSINARGIEIGDVGFFGVSGAPVSRLHTPYELTEEEIHSRIMSGYEQMRKCASLVFVPHAPPFGSKLDIIHAGIHVGSSAVRNFIEDHTPSVVICGHIHEGRGQDVIGRTKIVNCGAAHQGHYAIVEIGETVQAENRTRRK